MTEEREIRRLRQLWQRLEAPEAVDDGAASRDPETEAALVMLRGAWAALEAPKPPDRLVRPERPGPSPILAAVAAVVTALLTALAFGDRSPGPDFREATRAAVVDTATETATNAEVETGPVVRTRALDDGVLEIKRGRLRLLLVPARDHDENQPDH
ncbi:MAG: hypothetical protein H6807_10720 [Planctomycetes bacterium]|nr:hypothetical protein [Planctomycetota bacterium]